ncbi:MAG: hypothetical protein QG608_2707, partial [Actinomycetota bacterium]|nr:hypothetical protein [Actinomycetota bacterium]
PPGIHPPRHLGLHLWILRRPVPDTDPPREILLVDATEFSDDTGLSDATGSSDVLDPAPGTPAGESPSPARQRAGKALEDLGALRDGLLALSPAHREGRKEPGPTGGPGTLSARAVPVTELLDDTVDLTPVRRVGASAPARPPRDQAAATQNLLDGLDQALTSARSATALLTPCPAGGSPRRWRTATVADLLRGRALTLLRASPGDPVTVEPGDVLVPEVLREDGSAVRVVGQEEAGESVASRTLVLRPDPQRLDPWFVAGFCSAEPNLRVVSSSLRTTSAGATFLRPDLRRLKIPLMSLPEQREYGRQFEHLRAMTRALASAVDLAGRATRSFQAGLASGALAPGRGDTPGSSPR